MRNLSWFDRVRENIAQLLSARLVTSMAAATVVLAAYALAADGRQMMTANDVVSEVGVGERVTIAAANGAFVQEPDRENERAGNTTPLSLGDQIKVAVFERLETVGEGEKEKRGTIGLVEQTTLTGDYVVQQSGHVVLPMLGAFEAADSSIDRLSREIRKAYVDAFRQDAKVSISITDRRPIYVLGTGSKAGTFKFSPGMTVLHALALVGSPDDERRDVYLQSELVRQRERHATSLRKLEKAIIRSIVLRAERDGTVPQSTPAVNQISGTEKATVAIEGELKVRKLIGELKQTQIDAARSTIATARQEIAEINRKVTILNEHIGVKKLRKEALSRLTDSRSANPFLSNQVSGEVFEVEERRQEVLLSLSQAQRKLAQAEADLSRLVTEQALELEKDIAVVEQEATEEENAVASSERFVQELHLQDARVSLTKEPMTFEIVRQTLAGPQRLNADEMTELKAGDLVRVRSNRPL